jgi:hypothetical protein
MKKISILVTTIILFSSLSTFGASTLSISDKQNLNEINSEILDIQFVKPDISKIDNYNEVDMDGINGKIFIEGEPVLPVYSKTITFPFNTEILDINFEPGKIKTIYNSGKIIPGPKPVTMNSDICITENNKESFIYSSAELYPNCWFNYYINAGRDENNKYTKFLTFRIYPVRYSPVENKIQYIENVEISINYRLPNTEHSTINNGYDLIIIAPSDFTSELEKLVTHKSSFGVQTLLKTTEDIYDEFSGIDKPEQIKYFIKYAFDNWNIKYVLLVGGMKSLFFGDGKDNRNQGSKNWHFPVRYTNHYEGNRGDPGFISDLYYADIYDGEGSFSSWDTDGDGIFAYWHPFKGKDEIDMFPEVFVGRLACRNNFEVKIMVDKIINYESTPVAQDWFNNFVAVAGDTHNDENTNYYEGELMCDYVLDNYLAGYNPVKLYASNRDIDSQFTCSSDNIKRELNAGCGHIFFTGHGNPASWNTHWPGDFGWNNTPGGINCYDFFSLNNKEKLPVCVVEACHNSQFNVTFFSYGLGFPECWSWWLTRKIGGGAIATLGHTGLSYEIIGETGDLDGDGENLPDCLETVCGYQNRQFYKTIGEGVDILGEVWGGTINKYLTTFPAMDSQIDAKTISQWVLLGDPSLKIGGYP